MNAAARTLQQGALFRGWSLRPSRETLWLLVLAGCVLLSAFSLVFVTHLLRDTQAQYQAALQRNHDLQMVHSQLLLERSTLSMPDRVQTVAKQRFHMVYPSPDQVVVVALAK